jgi:hypothetical protein
MAALRAEFAAQGRRQCATLLGSLRSDFDAAAARRIVHGWSGLGGSLDLPGVTRAARALERLLMIGQPVPPPVLERRLRELGELFVAADCGSGSQPG